MMRPALFGTTVLSAMMICGVAAAQETAPTPPPPMTGDPAAKAPAVPVQEEPTQVVAPTPAQPQRFSDQATMTGQTATAATVSTTQTTSAEQPVYVNKEKSCGLIDHSCKHAHVEFALDGGGAGMNESGPFGFNTSIGHVTSAGPAWGARIGADLLPWLGADLHYIGMNNQVKGEAASTNGGTALLTTAGTVEVRFIAPIPYVQPYAIVGAGIYHTAVTGSDAATAHSQLYSGSALGVPMGVGLNIPISDGISAGGEAVYHRLFGESFSNNADFEGGEYTTFNAVVRAKL